MARQNAPIYPRYADYMPEASSDDIAEQAEREREEYVMAFEDYCDPDIDEADDARGSELLKDIDDSAAAEDDPCVVEDAVPSLFEKPSRPRVDPQLVAAVRSAALVCPDIR